jgi:Fur family ferric uptake transcriptional regulator
MSQGDASVRERLHQAGLRVTGPRQAVLEWLASHPHATADEIGRGVRANTRPVSRQAVYDVLAVCADAGLVRWFEPAGHPARYERNTGDNHHHLVCRGCGRIDDVEGAIGAQPCLAVGEDRGYELDVAEVVFWGVCPDCSSAAVPGGDAASHPSDHEEERQ